MYIDLKGGMK